MNIWVVIVSVCAVCIALGLLESIRECKGFVETHYTIESSKLMGIDEQKVVMLSDLHNKEYGDKNEKLLKAICEAAPDYIMVAGDMLIGKQGEPIDAAVDFMKAASKIAPLYYGNGNHEQRMREMPEYYDGKYEEYRGILLEHGVNLLENQSAEVDLGGCQACVTGVEIPIRFFEKFNSYKFHCEDIEHLVGKSSNSYQILIAHNPLYSEMYAKWGADLVLSGHLHGGIIRLPFIGGVITPQVNLLPKYSGGHYKVSGADIVVSKGLGEHTMKLRFLNKPELIVLHLKSKTAA